MISRFRGIVLLAASLVSLLAAAARWQGHCAAGYAGGARIRPAAARHLHA